MIQMTAISLFDLRKDLEISQDRLAKVAGVAQGTISAVENGSRPNLKHARQIWEAINQLREQKGLPKLAFEDIAWNW